MTTATTNATIESTFTRFEEYQPTAFDARGLGVSEEQRDWLVFPMSHQPKISTLLDDSNWGALCAAMSEADPDGTAHEVHYFRHWTSDFEIMVVRPGSPVHAEAERLAASLADDPALDDSDLSNRKYNQQHADITDGLRSLTVLAVDGAELDLDAPPSDATHEDRATYLVQQIWEHMWNDGQPRRCLEETGQPGGGGVDRDDVERALVEMGFVEEEHGTFRATE